MLKKEERDNCKYSENIKNEGNNECKFVQRKKINKTREENERERGWIIAIERGGF